MENVNDVTVAESTPSSVYYDLFDEVPKNFLESTDENTVHPRRKTSLEKLVYWLGKTVSNKVRNMKPVSSEKDIDSYTDDEGNETIILIEQCKNLSRFQHLE